VRRASERDRACAEERPAQVGRATAAPRDHTPGRTFERCVAPVDDSRRDEHGEGLRVARDVQLVAGRGVERPAPVRPDLRSDAARAQQREGAPDGRSAPEVEVKPPVPRSAQMQTSRGVEERRELGEPVALSFGRDRRELVADVLGRDQRITPSRARSRRLTSTPASP